MDGAQTPDQIDRVDAHHRPAREKCRKDAHRDAVVYIIERRHQHHLVRHVEVHVARRQAPAPIRKRSGHGDFHHLYRPAVLKPQPLQSLPVFRQGLIVGILRARLPRQHHGVRAHKPANIVHVPVRVVTGDTATVTYTATTSIAEAAAEALVDSLLYTRTDSPAMTAVGIDAMEIWTGKLKLDLPGTFAPEHGDDPEKYTKGLGLTNSSFPDVYEDIVTMGANAAKGLMDREGLEPEDVGRIDVATARSHDQTFQRSHPHRGVHRTTVLHCGNRTSVAQMADNPAASLDRKG